MKKKIFGILGLACAFALGGCEAKNKEPEIEDVKRDFTVYLAGDSTVKTYESNQYIGGWGQYLSQYLDDSITVVNAAQGGRSSRSFINEGRLYDISDSSYSYSFTQNDGKSIGSVIKEGDYLFIQFGHNDDDTKMASSYSTVYDRMVPLGTPDENGIYPVTEGKKVSTTTLPFVYTSNVSSTASALKEIAKYGSEYYSYDCGGTYKWYLKQYVDFARSKGATPVLVTPVARVKFSGETIIGGAGLHGENFAYVEAVRQLAKEEDCLLIDLFSETKTFLETATPQYANYLMALKPNDLVGEWPSGYDTAYNNVDLGYTGIEATHYNKFGAFITAGKVAEVLKTSNTKCKNNEVFNFKSQVLSTPKSYVDAPNLLSKTKVEDLKKLFSTVTAVNPNQVYNDPTNVVAKISTITGEVTNDNYKDIQVLCNEAKAMYNALNVDDRASVTNYNVLTAYIDKVNEKIIENSPKPVKVVKFLADDAQEIMGSTASVTCNTFKIVGNSSKPFDVRTGAYSFKYNNETYTLSRYVSFGGSADFNNGRYIEFTTEGKCKVTIASKSTNASNDRTLKVENSTATFAAAGAGSVTTVDFENAGTYKVGSSSSGVYIYAIIIEYYA